MAEVKPKQTLECVKPIKSTEGDFETGDTIPATVPLHARNRWVKRGLARVKGGPAPAPEIMRHG